MAREGRQDRTPDELQLASRALYYEVWMLNEMVKCLSTQSPKPGTPSYNALVESFVLHARNLIEFFYPKPSVHEDTIVAQDFLADWEQGIPPWLDNIRDHTHKLLAHLTFDRILEFKDYEGWDFRKIGNHLNELLSRFLSEVPPNRIGEDLKPLRKRMKLRLRH